MKWKAFLWVAGYATFMIAYFLVLTMFLPSTVVYKPDRITIGSYAEYSVEDWGFYNEPIRNGTYTWRIVSVNNVDGRIVVSINETYAGTSEWSHGSSIPSAGSIVDVDVVEGVVNGLPLWFNKFYVDYLVDRSIFRGFAGGYSFEGRGLENISVNGETKACIRLTYYIPSIYRTSSYWFDRATGILLRYHYGFRQIQIDMLLKSTNIVGDFDNTKVFLDTLLILPLGILPSVGAITGLLFMRRKKCSFSRRSWMVLALLNGLILSFISNWPLPVGSLTMIFDFPPLAIGFLLGAAFWFGVLVFAIFLINRSLFKIVTQSK